VNGDGWYNTDVSHGQYDQYQEASAIDTTQPESAIASADRLKLITENGRIYERLAWVILTRREGLANAVSKQEKNL